MSYNPHGKIVLSGEFGASGQPAVETWSASMSYDVVGPDVGAMPNTLSATAIAAVASAWAPVFNNIAVASSFSNTMTFTDVAYYRVKEDGTSTTGTWQRYHLPTVARGGDSNARLPIQTACVVSLDAEGPRGGRFGRFYLPAPALVPGTDYRWTTAQVDALLTLVRTALTNVNTALNADIEGDVELVVASGRGDGENRPVRHVRIGRVPDTMRSRRSGLAEQYSVQAFQAVP